MVWYFFLHAGDNKASTQLSLSKVVDRLIRTGVHYSPSPPLYMEPKYRIGQILKIVDPLSQIPLLGVCDEIETLPDGRHEYWISDLMNPHGRLPRSMLGSEWTTAYEDEILPAE